MCIWATEIIFIRTQNQDSFQCCGLCSCTLCGRTNNFDLSAILLSCLVSEVQKPSLLGVNTRQFFRHIGLCFCNIALENTIRKEKSLSLIFHVLISPFSVSSVSECFYYVSVNLIYKHTFLFRPYFKEWQGSKSAWSGTASSPTLLRVLRVCGKKKDLLTLHWLVMVSAFELIKLFCQLAVHSLEECFRYCMKDYILCYAMSAFFFLSWTRFISIVIMLLWVILNAFLFCILRSHRTYQILLICHSFMYLPTARHHLNMFMFSVSFFYSFLLSLLVCTLKCSAVVVSWYFPASNPKLYEIILVYHHHHHQLLHSYHIVWCAGIELQLIV